MLEQVNLDFEKRSREDWEQENGMAALRERVVMRGGGGGGGGGVSLTCKCNTLQEFFKNNYNKHQLLRWPFYRLFQAQGDGLLPKLTTRKQLAGFGCRHFIQKLSDLGHL